MTEKCHYLWHPNYFPMASGYKFLGQTTTKHLLLLWCLRGWGTFWPCHCLRRLHVFTKVGFTSDVPYLCIYLHTKLFDLKNSWDISVSSDYSDCVKSCHFLTFLHAIRILNILLCTILPIYYLPIRMIETI